MTTYADGLISLLVWLGYRPAFTRPRRTRQPAKPARRKRPYPPA